MQTTLTHPVDLLLSHDFDGLMVPPGDVCVSLYLPTHHAGREIRQDPIRLKNLARRAEESLRTRGLRDGEIPAILHPVRKLLEDGIFWHYQSRGLAIFLAPNWNRFFRLPLPFEELAVVGDRFHLKPLLPLLTRSNDFFVLALSQKRVRLFRCGNHVTEEVELEEDVPRNKDEALGWDDRPKQGRQGFAGGGRTASRGHGPGREDEKVDLERFCQLIDKGLTRILPNHATPLVISGTDPLVGIYREVSSYPHLEPHAVPGNPDQLEPEELHVRAWEIVRPRFDRVAAEQRTRFEELANKRSSLAAVRVESVVPAAMSGRVEVLFVPLTEQCWGSFDREEMTVSVHGQRHPGDEDLLDLAAVQTFARGGTVHAVASEDLPGPGPVAAILRY
ncbi:MAG: hypothetical protein KC729_04255 [Candidatus Eisenbacteria bacterium]|uniref:Uncharacterized protein n=1 Tax=Eiseniibacteriota bacterium TaxID=2212470 RepID=A0A956LXN2_UNCEI|nr:hypothetical protein [Candidatus Eisenbacteria bacterium]